MRRANQDKASAVKKKYEMTWMRIEGVVGVNTQNDVSGQLCICISTKGGPEKIKKMIGEEVEGIKIIFEDVGGIELASAND